MVNRFYVGLFCLTLSCASSAEITADELHRTFKKNDQEQQSAAERLKAGRIDSKSLRLLEERDIQYKLPNGKLVMGVLLPNGKVAPAIETSFGKKPACVTNDYTLVLGYWDNGNNIIKCKLDSSELAYVGEELNQMGIDGQVAGQRPVGETPKQQQAKADKYSVNPKKAPKESSSKAPETQHRNKTATNGNIYVPPPRNGGSANTTAGVMSSTKDKFGISMGTWIKAELIRPASSAESGQIEFRVMESVDGRYQTLPANTVLFAQKSFNSANRRLEAMTTTAITPSGDEIGGVNAYVYSDDKTAGLTGSIIRNREQEAVEVGSSALLAAAVSAVPGGNSVASEAAGEFASEMLQNERQMLPKSTGAIIEVSPQPVWLKVNRTF